MTEMLGGLQKLTIIPLKKMVSDTDASYSLDTGAALEAQFNPETFTVSKGNNWTFRPDIGDNIPEAFFSGGKAQSINVDLFFDTTDTGGNVQLKYWKLVELSLVDEDSESKDGKGQPKQVIVMWGNHVYTNPCVIQNFRQEFLMFKEDGTPLRANVHICLKEVYDDKDKAPQNPTSRTEARRTWIVEQGQRLDWIAHEEYGDSSAWRHIAETNGIDNPLAIRPGQILNLVPLE